MLLATSPRDPFLQKQSVDTFSAYFRQRRFVHIESIIRRIHREKGTCSIIDVGGREEYWSPILATLADCGAKVTIVNLEKTQPVSGQHFEFVYGDVRDLSMHTRGQFDFAHSNSLIEHVGRWPDMKRCADEIRRVGESYYVQTPYFWFPLEPHFRVPLFHWLPEQIRAKIIMYFKVGYFNRAQSMDHAMRDVQSACLLDRSQMRALFPDADVSFERVAGLPKSLMAIRRQTDVAAIE
jgi:hypothetical protein